MDVEVLSFGTSIIRLLHIFFLPEVSLARDTENVEKSLLTTFFNGGVTEILVTGG